MKEWSWVIVLLGFLISSCGKKGDLVYEGESNFPRVYPSDKES